MYKMFVTTWARERKVPVSHSNIFLFKRHQKVRQRARDAASRGKVPMSPHSPPLENSLQFLFSMTLPGVKCSNF